MSRLPKLYVGIAAPLVEIACVWEVDLPDCADKEALRQMRATFPCGEIEAYSFDVQGASTITFRTGVNVSMERVCAAVEGWCGHGPRSVPPDVDYESVPALDHGRLIADLREALGDWGAHVVGRLGLTLANLQEDMSHLHPELVLLYCHGTDEGCVLLEDGRGMAHVVPGDWLFPRIAPRPRVLVLGACRSGKVLAQAGVQADWPDSAIVHAGGETGIKAAACVTFASAFFRELVRGRTAGEAFDLGTRQVDSVPDLNATSVGPEGVPPSEKFEMDPAARGVRLDATGAPSSSVCPTDDAPPLRRSIGIGCLSERFAGRRREMSQVIDVLLPRRTGLPQGPHDGERRIVTLTKEGGIGKTAMALAVADWAHQRGYFPGGIFELSCERLATGEQLLAELLRLADAGAEARPCDGCVVLAEAFRRFDQDRDVLLVLDSPDDLLGKDVEPEVRRQAGGVLEAMLKAAPRLRILSTCRWPLGLGNHEYVLELGPLCEEDARDVFISHLESEGHQDEVRRSWGRLDSPVRQLVHMSGRHPQSLQLLARQMRRPGMTFRKLRDEAGKELLAVLVEPLAAYNETDRLKRVAVSFELSYRRLRDEGKRLFERLAHLPDGVWCGDLPEDALRWGELFGRDWRTTMEKELDYFALVHFDPEGPPEGAEGEGTFRMLNPMREFALEKFRKHHQEHVAWERDWITFWRKHLEDWDDWLSGRVLAGGDGHGATASELRKAAIKLFARTQPNWMAAFRHVVGKDTGLAYAFLLGMASFCQCTAQRAALRHQTVKAVRESQDEKARTRALVTLGDVQSALGQREEAWRTYADALGIYQRLDAEQPGTFGQEWATTLNNLGDVQASLGTWDMAWESYARALAIERRLADAQPNAHEPDLSFTLNRLQTAEHALVQP